MSLAPESTYDDLGGSFAPSEVIIKCRSRMKDQVAMAVADNLVVTKNQPKIFGPFILHQVRLCTKFIFYTKFEATPSSLSLRLYLNSSRSSVIGMCRQFSIENC